MVQCMRVIGTPGASLHTSGLKAENVEAGVEGERLVAATIEHALKNTKATIVHSAKLHPKRGDTDHLVLAGGKLLIIDSKLWSGTTFTSEPGTDQSIQVQRDGETFAGGNVGLPRQRSMWAKHLGIPESDVLVILAIARSSIRVPKEPVNGVHFATLDSLPLKINALIGTALQRAPLEHLESQLQRTSSATTVKQPEDLSTLTPRWAPALPLLWAVVLFSGQSIVFWISAVMLFVAVVSLTATLLRHRPIRASQTLIWLLASSGVLIGSLLWPSVAA